MPNLQVESLDVQKLKIHDKNPKQHSKKQIGQIAQSIKEFGFVSPILADEQLEIIAGHGRLAAAKTLSFTQVPVIILSHLTAQQKIAYAIADNKLTELGTWNMELLQDEFQLLMAQDLDFDMTVTGFETGDIDLIVNPANKTIDTKADILPELNDADKVCQSGDIWQLGHHRLVCDNSLHRCTYNALFGDNSITITEKVFLRKYVNTVYDRGKNGVLNVTDNNHLILKAFATAWKYRELYEQDGGVDDIIHNLHTSPRQFYRYLDIAYMNPDKINQILSGKLKTNVNDLFQIAKENQILER